MISSFVVLLSALITNREKLFKDGGMTTEVKLEVGARRAFWTLNSNLAFSYCSLEVSSKLGCLCHCRCLCIRSCLLFTLVLGIFFIIVIVIYWAVLDRRRQNTEDFRDQIAKLCQSTINISSNRLTGGYLIKNTWMTSKQSDVKNTGTIFLV